MQAERHEGDGERLSRAGAGCAPRPDGAQAVSRFSSNGCCNVTIPFMFLCLLNSSYGIPIVVITVATFFCKKLTDK